MSDTYFQKVGLKAMAAAETGEKRYGQRTFPAANDVEANRDQLNALNRLFWLRSTSWCSWARGAISVVLVCLASVRLEALQ